MTAIMLFALINVAITSTHVWRKHYIQHLRSIAQLFRPKNPHFPRKKSIRIFIHNTEGQQLAFNAETERDIYFRQLKQAWT
jgi:hypothetical protein